MLFLTVCVPLIHELYPAGLRVPLTERDLFRPFRLLVATHVVLVYATVGVLVWLATDTPRWLLAGAAPLGIPPGGWIQLWVVGYGTLILPLSLGGLLSRLEDGLTAWPTADGPAMGLVRNLQPGATGPTEFDSPVLAWWFVGLVHALPAVALGVGFVVIETLPPVVEGLLAVGIVVALVGSGDPARFVAAFDLEHRLGRTLRFMTVNLRSAVSAASIFLGVTLVGVLVLRVGPLAAGHWTAPRPHPGWWSRLGVLAGLTVYAVGMAGHWLRLADRLPWFVTAWTAASTRYDARAFRAPSADCPPRFPLGPLLPALFFVGALQAIAAPGSPSATLYAVGWPIGVGVGIWQLVRRPPVSTPAARDNWAIPVALAVQVVLLFYQVSLPVSVETGAFSVPTAPARLSAAPDLLVLGGVAVAAIVWYFVPELTEFATARAGDQSETAAQSSADADRLRLLRLSTTLGFGLSVWATAVMAVSFGITIGVFLRYLLGGMGTITALLWWLDPDQFERLDRLPPRTETLADLGVLLYFLGVTLLSRESLLIPESVSLAGVGATVLGMAFVVGRYCYHRVWERSQAAE
ncbi:hypothetical protein C463_17283 [Halorubrum californiense DSM 19288]|uniref:Uncharacterized protein n=1 Tax=Halorubrum californiense DSM 19288 TaxID=1227465 RepID=M0DYL4_9EURY|nr:hypothetical protein C463_17283 [Halorubrum californiense DSM 19288]